MMQTIIVLLVTTLFGIAAAASIAPRLRVPAPLLLVVAGIAISLIPAVPDIVIEPDIILMGLLPPLLYASATSISVVNLRREFTAINGLSIVLVILTALALGALCAWLIPGLGFGWGVAIGAVLSPTDAVATTIIKGRGVPGRVAVLLDGESLLNDASALIILRTAIAATAAGFAFWPTLGGFVLSIAVAFVVGRAAALANLAIRCRVRNEAVNTILSFTTPFAAAIPAEMLHGSGLVAAVVAGFVIGARAPRDLPPGHRVSDAQTWATIEIALEGGIFLTMGLQLSTIVKQVAIEPAGIQWGLVCAALALGATLAVRATYVVLLLWNLHRRALRRQARRQEFSDFQRDLEAGHVGESIKRRFQRLGLRLGDGMVKRLVGRGRRLLGDLDYLARQPLGKAEAAVVVWGGMRGAVTVAAVQLLPASTPHRPLLVFIAFAVATLSLLIQGGTIGLLVSRLFPPAASVTLAAARAAEGERIRGLVEGVATQVRREPTMTDKAHQIAVLAAQRNALLDARDDGIFDIDALRLALRDVDIDEIVLELRSRPADAP